MRTGLIRRAATLLALFLLVRVPAARAQLPETEYEGAAALGLELRRLGTTKRVLMIGAHPDDENTQILSTLALGQGADVAYLSLTRGEGGQNGIGPELGEGLGLLRTEELLAARRLDGARQYFTRAYDFGFSKSAEEAFRHWPREEILGDVVAVIRHFRPDVVLSVFSGTPRDGHGQHQVAGILAREAFLAAGDSTRFPEQIRAGLRPFAPRKLYQTLWGDNEGADFSLQTGQRDPLLGRSYYQVAMASRSRHRSQDMGRPLTPGPQESGFELLRPGGTAARDAGLFAGVDTTLSGLLSSLGKGVEGSAVAVALPLVRDYEQRVSRIQAHFNPLQPGNIAEELADALRTLRAAMEPFGNGAVRDAVAAEAADVEAALWDASGLDLDVVASDEAIVPGQTLELTLILWNGGPGPIQVEELEPVVPRGWTVTPQGPATRRLGAGELLELTYSVHVADDAPLTRPYFLSNDRRGDLYTWTPGRTVGIPFDSAVVAGRARVRIGDVSVTSTREASFLKVDERQGEIRRPLRVVPAVSVALAPGTLIVPLSGDGPKIDAFQVVVTVRSEAAHELTGRFVLDAPDGWSVEPGEVPLRLSGEGEARTVRLTVRPPAGLEEGEVKLAARFVTGDGREYRQGYQLIDYPHVHPRPLFRQATTAVRAFPIELPGELTVGYVPGAGDDAPEALRQLGVSVTILTGEQLASADLRRFDAILTGIRAYEVNPYLVAYNRRLLDYARAGGTLVVQYNKYEYTEPGIAPYRVTMSRPHDRVTDEAAEVRLLDLSHPALSWPNRITAADFEGWRQERGLYFLSEWDERFTPLLEMADPGEAPLRGGLLVAPLGEGTYVYTGLSFFRQLPEGVPGAYRLLVNLLSLGQHP